MAWGGVPLAWLLLRHTVCAPRRRPQCRVYLAVHAQHLGLIVSRALTQATPLPLNVVYFSYVVPA